MKSPTGHFVPFVLLILVAGLAVYGQDLDDVTISGKIVDSNGLSIVGATVSATQIESNLERTVISDDDGRYRFIELKPGIYKLHALAEGFAARELVSVRTLSGQSVRLDISLTPAGVTAEATVTVGDTAPVLDTTRIVNLGWQPRIALREGLVRTYAWALREGVLTGAGGTPQ